MLHLQVNHGADVPQVCHGTGTVDDTAAGGNDAVLHIQLRIDTLFYLAEASVPYIVQNFCQSLACFADDHLIHIHKL